MSSLNNSSPVKSIIAGVKSIVAGEDSSFSNLIMLCDPVLDMYGGDSKRSFASCWSGEAFSDRSYIQTWSNIETKFSEVSSK